MKLGIAENFPHSTPEEWAKKHIEAHLEAVVFPCHHTSDIKTIDAYVQAAQEAGLVIAEVGIWNNPMSPDPQQRAKAIAECKHQLELAEYIKARCCVNIVGGFGERFDGAYAENFSEQRYAQIVRTIQDIVDAVNPVNSCYTLEPMPHMLPDSPEEYLRLLKHIDRPGVKVHMDAVNMIASPRRYFASGAFVERCFALLGDQIVSCHIKDCVISSKLPVEILETECGQGGFDIKRYLQEADAVSPDMPMIIEHLSRWDQYLAAIAYVRQLYAQR